MGVQTYTAQGYEAFQTVLRSLGSGKRIVAFFTGSKLLTTGKSWCPDCVDAEPVVDKVIAELDSSQLDVHFVTVFVGNREVWKSPESQFRTDPKLKLTCIPTLLEVNNKAKRLTEEQIANPILVKDFFNEED